MKCAEKLSNTQNSKETILVTGGCGYIGIHIVLQLLETGYNVIIVDNLGNSTKDAYRRLKKIISGAKDVKFYEADLCNKEQLTAIFQKEKIEHVIHCAGHKSVSDSVENPLKYYRNNLMSSISLIETMQNFNVNSIIFSSSATVYGVPQYLPLDEKHPTGNCLNPYGTSKHMIENILMDVNRVNKNFKVTILRYFNPVGSHKSGMFGEDNTSGAPGNIMPYLLQYSCGKLEMFSVYGSDYQTHDGTGVRDYIHIVDLAKAHVKALNPKMKKTQTLSIYNLGTGIGYSVLDMLNAFGKVMYKIVARRPGDVDCVFADPKLAKIELDWEAEHSLDDMCRDAHLWIIKNKDGYKDTTNEVCLIQEDENEIKSLNN